MQKVSILASAVIASSAGLAHAQCPAGSSDITALVPAAALTATNASFACSLAGVYDSASPAPTLTQTDGGNLWVLDGKVEVGNETDVQAVDSQSFGVVTADANATTLTIDPGAVIVGTGSVGGASDDYLIIHRGSDIDAEGAVDNPIRFQSMQSIDGTGGARAQWGGLYINGYASINNCGLVAPAGQACMKYGEAGTGTYGGATDTDDSGILKYVTVANAGFAFTSTSEFNGIAFQGVGSGTEVDYIQVDSNQDDGVEFFGGTVNVKHVVLTANRDDSFDVTGGWSGAAQYVLVYQPAGLPHDRGFEIDGKGTFEPADGVVSNITVISGSATNKDGGSSDGIKSREDNALTYINSVISMTDGSHDCYDADTQTSSLVAAYGSCTFGSQDLQDGTFGSGAAVAYSADFNGYVNGLSESIQIGVNANAQDPRLEAVSFVGAVESCENDWTLGWTIPGTLPTVNAAACAQDAAAQVNVPVMGWAGLMALFGTLTGVAALRRRIR